MLVLRGFASRYNQAMLVFRGFASTKLELNYVQQARRQLLLHLISTDI